MKTKASEYRIDGFLTEDQKTILTLKALRMGFDISFKEYAVSTFITVMKT